MPFWKTIGNIASTIAGPAMGLMLEKHNDERQLNQQQKLTNMQYWSNKQLMDDSFAKQYEMWEKTNYAGQKAQLEKAGLNPALMYGMGGGGGVTTGSGGGSVGGGSAPSGGGEIMGLMNAKLQQDLLKAQVKATEAQANKTNTEAENLGEGGASRENILADTANKVLEGVIKDYTGREMRDVYNRVTAPGRAVQAKTYVDEMEARQGIAGTIYELWLDGKLKEKALSEIEAIALGNSKTKEETARIKEDTERIKAATKGANLDNMLKDLELKLQQRTGIDRNSPSWLRILGRFFADLAGPNTN